MEDSGYSIQKHRFSFELRKKESISRKKHFSLLRTRDPRAEAEAAAQAEPFAAEGECALVNFYGLYFHNLDLFSVPGAHAAAAEERDSVALFRRPSPAKAPAGRSRGLWQKFKSLFRRKKAAKSVQERFAQRFRAIVGNAPVNREGKSGRVFPGLKQSEVLGFAALLENAPFHECEFCPSEKTLIRRIFQKDILDKGNALLDKARGLVGSGAWRALEAEAEALGFAAFVRGFMPKPRVSAKKVKAFPPKKSSANLKILNKKILAKISKTELFLTKFHKTRRLVCKAAPANSKSWVVRKWKKTFPRSRAKRLGGNKENESARASRKGLPRASEQQSTRDQTASQLPPLTPPTTSVMSVGQTPLSKFKQIGLKYLTQAGRARAELKLDMPRLKKTVNAVRLSHLLPKKGSSAEPIERTGMLSTLNAEAAPHVPSTRNYKVPKSNAYLGRFLRVTGNRAQRPGKSKKERFFRSKLVNQGAPRRHPADSRGAATGGAEGGTRRPFRLKRWARTGKE